MTYGLVHASYSLPNWKAIKLTFFTPCIESINPLSPSIHIQILQTELHTFPLRIS